VFADEVERDEAVIAVIVAFMCDAERMAVVTAGYLNQLGPLLKSDRTRWPAAFLLELGAVLRIHQWEAAGIKDAIDATLPCSQAAFADLASRLQTGPERFIRGDAPLLLRVLRAWWSRCAHPNIQFLDVDVVLPQVERGRLVLCVAQLLWKLRDLETNTTMGNDSNEQ
jgi:hypothetical protein